MERPLALPDPEIERSLARGLRRWGQRHFSLCCSVYVGLVVAVIVLGNPNPFILISGRAAR